ncbi:TetR/AcrR family transcriptional regulator [Flavobacterium sp. '19STA2R22 D10 B1']|uniref:TetR/AcrR family transcriptional regulator n=1 Tax=Flavobacterium aerium TaxID=3037261 RepID=UPI00278C1A61|nr:TetR/AcrR family transcriptional regulator [Flavobacterium sp. '19STA2R22 D10 B1']
MTKAERTRQFIIEKAAPIINQKGIAGTAISDIMEATKLAKGGIYGNFESKDEICLEAFNYLTKGVADGIDRVLIKRNTAKDKLFFLLDHYTNDLAMNDLGGCPLLNFGTETDDTNPQIKMQVNKAIMDAQNRIKNIVEEGMAKGEFNKNVDAELFAIKTFALVEGGILIGRIQGNTNQMKKIMEQLKIEIESF